MRSDYLIDRSTLAFLRDLYQDQSTAHPDCQIGFGWGGDSTGWQGPICGMHEDASQRIPPIYHYQEVPIYLAFTDNMPEEMKSGVICFRDGRFEIRPVEEFKLTELVEGFTGFTG